MKNVDAGILSRQTLSQPQYLGALTLFYILVVVLSNWFNARIITVFGLSYGSGVFIFALTYVLSDLITEVYGYNQAKRAILGGFFFNLAFVIYSQIIIRIPSPDFAAHNAPFDELLAFNSRIIMASMLSYLIAEPMNAYLLARMKIKLKGAYIGLRFLASTIAASGLDTIIFCTLAFYGVINDDVLFIRTMQAWGIKLTVEALALPFAIRIAKKLKKAEGLDTFDNDTDFNLLKFSQKKS